MTDQIGWFTFDGTKYPNHQLTRHNLYTYTTCNYRCHLKLCKDFVHRLHRSIAKPKTFQLRVTLEMLPFGFMNLLLFCIPKSLPVSLDSRVPTWRPGSSPPVNCPADWNPWSNWFQCSCQAAKIELKWIHILLAGKYTVLTCRLMFFLHLLCPTAFLYLPLLHLFFLLLIIILVPILLLALLLCLLIHYLPQLVCCFRCCFAVTSLRHRGASGFLAGWPQIWLESFRCVDHTNVGNNQFTNPATTWVQML